MLYVGLDIHIKQISICVLNENGKLDRRAQVRSIDEMINFLEQLPDRFEVGYEASCGYDHYHDLLRPLATRVVVAHPGQLRLIFRSKHKNDRHDAEKLAKLLFLGETPAVHVPSPDVRAWRELITCRIAAVREHEGVQPLRSIADVGVHFGPSDLSLGARRRLGAAEAPRLKPWIVRPHEPRYWFCRSRRTRALRPASNPAAAH